MMPKIERQIVSGMADKLVGLGTEMNSRYEECFSFRQNISSVVPLELFQFAQLDSSPRYGAQGKHFCFSLATETFPLASL
jgi:hypothetical protein